MLPVRACPLELALGCHETSWPLWGGSSGVAIPGVAAVLHIPGVTSLSAGTDGGEEIGTKLELARWMSPTSMVGDGDDRLRVGGLVLVGVPRLWLSGGAGRSNPATVEVGVAAPSMSMGSSSVPAGPGVGLRPSRNALEMSAAFHFAYLIFASIPSEISDCGNTFSTSKKLAAARNFFAVGLVAFPALSSLSALVNTLNAKFST